MLVPYNADAPIYHLPLATGGLIATNVVAFIALLALGLQLDEDTFQQIVNECILSHGRGLRPWQWISSNFVHGGFLHLLGNIVCLWGFGLVVEGKVDCEGWDLINVWKGTYGRFGKDEEVDQEAVAALLRRAENKRMQDHALPLSATTTAGPSLAAETSKAEVPATASKAALAPASTDNPLQAVRRALAAGNPHHAYSICREESLSSRWQVPERELLEIIRAFHKQQAWSESVPAMEEYLQHYRKREPQVRIKLAQIFMRIRKQPRQALAVLRPLETSQLSASQAEMVQKLRSQATQRGGT